MTSLKIAPSSLSITVDVAELHQLRISLDQLIRGHQATHEGGVGIMGCEDCEYVRSFITAINRALEGR